MYQLEACVETLAQAVHAEQLGAQRIELCADLHLDGLTPQLSLIGDVLTHVKIPVMVMVRPRSGNFLYNSTEIDTMLQTIAQIKKHGAAGIVFGTLTLSGDVDLGLINEICNAARPMLTTFHRAIESTSDIINAAKQLMEKTSIDCILTSGGKSSPLSSVAILKSMQQICRPDQLIVCGGITWQILEEIHNKIGAGWYHGRKIVGMLPDQI